MSFTSKAQQLIHQDIFHGGVTTGALSKGLFESEYVDTLQLYIEPNSSIRNAFLFYYRMGKPNPKPINVNGTTITLDTNSSTQISAVSCLYPNVDSVFTYKLDLREYLSDQDILLGQFIVHNPPSTFVGLNEETVNWGWLMPMFYIEYENSSLQKVNTGLFVNDLELIGNDFYYFSGMNMRQLNSPFALSLFLDRVCSQVDGTEVLVNSNSVGFINDIDSTTHYCLCSGAQGTYFFQDNQITGLYDDTPDNTVDGGDALIDLNSFLGSIPDYNLIIKHNRFDLGNMPNGYINNKLIFSNAYKTPCDTFSTSITADTVICYGDSLQITASGGVSYNWNYHKTLSDTTGASVWVKPTRGTVYTVQIENTPGCSRTENVAVKIHPSPKLNSVVIDTATCGEEDGKLTVNTSQNGAFQYNIGFGYQNSRYFNGVPAGTYLVQAKDYMGCVQELEVELPYKIEVQASFEANPTEGAKPLHVELENNSQNASDYNWYFNGSYFSDYEHENLLIDQSGEHFIDLIVFNKDSICADTASIKILVYDSLVLKIPNVFTPNGDGNNDVFSIQQNGAIALTYQIYNRWGSPVQSGEFKSPNETLVLWDGVEQTSQKLVNPGTYFYTITATNLQGEEFVFEGFVQVVR